MKSIKLKCNGCDGVYETFNIHFTSACDNNCQHCVDKVFPGFGMVKPDPAKIAETVISHKDGIKDVLFLGGEPCLYLDELIECLERIHEGSQLRCYLTTAVPLCCAKNPEKFQRVIELCDGVNLSVQHFDEAVADSIRGTISKYDRQAFYKSLPFKEKLNINMNLVRPHLCRREDVLQAIRHYDAGFRGIKFIEVQHAPKHYCSMEEIMGFRLHSAFAAGCSTVLTPEMIPELAEVGTTVILRRACFLTEPSIKATLLDGVKSLVRFIHPPKLAFRVVYEDGRLEETWK